MNPEHNSFSRRNIVLAGAAMITSSLPSCTRGEAHPVETANDTSTLQALLDRGSCLIVRRALPYRLVRPLVVRSPGTIAIEPGTRFVFTGPSPSQPIGVFTVDSDDVRLTVLGEGQAIVESSTPSVTTYAVAGAAVSGLRVEGIMGLNCNHVRVYGDPTGSHLARTIAVKGGGASFDQRAQHGDGACFVAFATDWSVTGSHYQRVCHGLEWWGGNAHPDVDGAPDRERKCMRFTIAGVVVSDASQAGIWGSMGRDGLVTDCTVVQCGDVGFDAEGCDRVTFRECRCEDATNGCFSTFFYSRDIVFADCTGVVADRHRPLFRTFNNTQQAGPSGTITIAGGRFRCTDPAGPSTIDTAGGPVRSLIVRDAALSNVRIDTYTNNMHRVSIINNQLTFPFAPGPGAAISAGGSRTLADAYGAPEQGGVTVTGNRITFAVPAITAIAVNEDDYNAAASGVIAGNRVSGSVTTAVALRNGTGNVGMQPSFRVTDNVLGTVRAGAAALALSNAGHGARPPRVDWRNNRSAEGRLLAGKSP